MAEITFLQPPSIGEALALLGSEGPPVKILAGGTDLLVGPLVGPLRILDITRIEALKTIVEVEDGLLLGAMTTHSDVVDAPLLARYAEGLQSACRQVGSVQIRNRGTLAGNVVNASPAGDALVALHAHGARLKLCSASGERWLAVEEAALGPKMTALRPDELLTHIHLPIRPGRTLSRFAKVGQRRALVISKVSFALAAGQDDDGVLNQVKFALGSVAPRVISAPEAGALLEGRLLTPEFIGQAADKAAEAATPIDDIRSTAAYRRQALSGLIRKTLYSCMKCSLPA